MRKAMSQYCQTLYKIILAIVIVLIITSFIFSGFLLFKNCSVYQHTYSDVEEARGHLCS